MLALGLLAGAGLLPPAGWQVKPPLDAVAVEQPLLPLLRVLCYLEDREYTLEFGQVEFANRWYTPARKLVHQVWTDSVLGR